MHNNQLFAPAKVNDACYVYIDISRYLSYSIKKRASWDSWNKDKKRAKIEKLRNEIKRKNDKLVKINNNYANSYRSLILFGTKYYEVSYSYDNTFKKRQVLISKFLQKVIDDDKNKCQYLCKNILKM